MYSAFWSSFLCVSEFAGGDERRAVVSKVLESNAFTRVRSLKKAEHPSDWIAGDTLYDSEMRFLSDIISHLQKAPSPQRCGAHTVRNPFIPVIAWQAKWK